MAELYCITCHTYFVYFLLFFFVSDTETVGNIKNVCRACSENFSKTSSPSLDAMFFIPSSTQVLYNLEVRTLYVDVYGQVALLACLFCDCTCIPALFGCLSVCLSVCMSCLSVCPSVGPCVCLSTCLPVIIRELRISVRFIASESFKRSQNFSNLFYFSALSWVQF